jgi:hypothetical protein
LQKAAESKQPPKRHKVTPQGHPEKAPIIVTKTGKEEFGEIFFGTFCHFSPILY